MAKIVIADDESKIRRLVCDFLRRSGYEAIEASTSQEVLDIFHSDLEVDLYILAVTSPEADSRELCRRLRKTSSVPIILLTERKSELDEVAGFDAGADDYVTKPFSPNVLIKRIEAILRRISYNGATAKKYIIALDGLIFNNDAHQVTIDNKPVELTLKEYNILQRLILSRDHVYTREQLLSDVWGSDYKGEARNIDSHVARLRSKLGRWGSKHLKTIYGIGYTIKTD